MILRHFFRAFLMGPFMSGTQISWSPPEIGPWS